MIIVIEFVIKFVKIYEGYLIDYFLLMQVNIVFWKKMLFKSEIDPSLGVVEYNKSTRLYYWY